jgi:SAM-dependent methyltransferase
MTNDLSFTGERFLPECSGEIAYEHWHRYAFARRFVGGKHVLDAACGEGYGTALLSRSAECAWGLDIDCTAVAHATASYGQDPRARFIAGSCAELPFADASFDVVVSFETVEHLEQADQTHMIAEFARVLRPEGVLVISSPNKALYSDARNFQNEFHLHELYRDDLHALLTPRFPVLRWWRQRLAYLSGLWGEEAAGTSAEAWLGDGDAVRPYEGPDAMYFVVIAAKSAAALPADDRRVSLFLDSEETEMARAEHHARETLRLDALLKDRDVALAQRSAHVLHLESLLLEHQRVVAQRDADLAARDAAALERERELARSSAAAAKLQAHLAEVESQSKRMSAALAAQERIIEYRQTGRWWLELPWLGPGGGVGSNLYLTVQLYNSSKP